MVDIHTLSYDFISLLTNNPEYITRTIITEDMIQEEYKLYFKIILEQYSRLKRIDVVELEKKNLRSLYESCLYNGIAVDIKDSFQSYQFEIIKIYKKKIANDLYNEWNKDVIDDNEYFRRLSNLQSITPTRIKKLTKKDVLHSLAKEGKRIVFNRFSLLMYTLKLEEHDLLTLSGDTGKGKTSLAINLLEDLSRSYPCLYFNMEMSNDQMNGRLTAIYSKQNLNELDKYNNQNDSFKKEVSFRLDNLFKNRDIYIVSESQNMNKITSTIASFNQNKHFIVFIDHAGLISVKGAKNAKERLDEVYKTLRKLSIDYNCTIISLCQLNRESVKNNPRPKLSSLKDSSEIEQSSSKVGFIFSVENDAKENYYFEIAKNRNGITGTMNLTYNKQNQVMEIVAKK